MKKRGNVKGPAIAVSVFLLAFVMLGIWQLGMGSREEMASIQTWKLVKTVSAPAYEMEEFLPDYISAPLLDTASIRDLTMEVGASEDEVRFNWLSSNGSEGRVVWKNADTGEKKEFQAECTESTTVPGYYVNKAAVIGIQPNATYMYQVGNGDVWSPEYTYQAPKDMGNSLTFLVTSDVQVGQAEMEPPEVTAERWDSVVTRLTRYVPEAEFLFHLGDQVAEFGNEEQYSGFLDHLALYKIPLAPVVGNHDVANDTTIAETGKPGGWYFYEHFNVPNRSEVGQSLYGMDGNYYFVRGETLFIVLNSDTIGSFDELEEYVGKAVRDNPDVRWRILVQHYSPYRGNRDGREHKSIQEYLARASIDNGIDLILTGHDHVYARSAIINRDCEKLEQYDYKSGGIANNPEGTLYVICGTSSGCLYHFAGNDERLVYQDDHPVPIALRVDVTDAELHLKAYWMDTWTVCDEYTLRKD